MVDAPEPHQLAGQRDVPDWVAPLADAVDDVEASQLSRFLPPPDGSARPAAVLMLFGEQADGPDVLLIERAHDMRSHPSHVAFPGGAHDVGDAGPVATALREAEEETGLDPAGVSVIGQLPELYLPPSNFAVTPVLAWWRNPSEVSVVDPAEVASVHRVPLAELLDPSHRYSVRHPSGFVGPAFVVREKLVWGFTGGLLSKLFAHVGWETPWDVERYTELPDHMVDEAWRRR
ncbi:MAG TPA: CoA pyrophosphatase [Nocardioidaceae bacterium]|nr:CoA pyrophosphatase [Nocardioidaceae bacterium]